MAWIYDNLHQSREEAKLDVVKYIEMYYNCQRLHFFLDSKTQTTLKEISLWEMLLNFMPVFI